jgi:hypothetical protein
MSLINFFANVLHLISKKSWILFTCTMANSNLLEDTYSLMTRVKWGVLVLETTHAHYYKKKLRGVLELASEASNNSNRLG